MAAMVTEAHLVKETGLLLPMLDARRMEVYCAGYDDEGKIIRPTEAKIIDSDSFAVELEQGLVYFFGNGSAKCATTLTHPNARFIPAIQCSAKGMRQSALKAFTEKQFEDVAYFEPFYLKDFVGTTPKK
jgi:tRNA threonylcarbamoyladenosine biosynthesis protein TsaB